MQHIKQIICLADPRELTEKMMNGKKGERTERLKRDGPVNFWVTWTKSNTNYEN